MFDRWRFYTWLSRDVWPETLSILSSEDNLSGDTRTVMHPGIIPVSQKHLLRVTTRDLCQCDIKLWRFFSFLFPELCKTRARRRWEPDVWLLRLKVKYTVESIKLGLRSVMLPLGGRRDCNYKFFSLFQPHLEDLLPLKKNNVRSPAQQW